MGTDGADFGRLRELADVSAVSALPHDLLTADEYAASAGTISYEMLCAVSARVPRYYE